MSHVAKTAEFRLYPSKYFLCAKLGLAVAAGLIIAAAPILLWAKVVGLFIALAVGYSFYNDFCRQSPEQLFVLDTGMDCWRLVSQASGENELRLEPTQFVTGYLVVLYFKDLQGTRFTRIIPRDSLSEEDHRLLRKLLISRKTS
ncbi:MAG: hypothetical protein P8H31_03735 [Porticoccaceae bacterium]|nr:hypothetical protein [Porticoccaceae bacterium]